MVIMFRTSLRLARVALIAFVGFLIARQAFAETPSVGKSGISGSPLSGLPADFSYIRYKKYLYTFFFNAIFSWNDAWDFCLNNGGELVTIETKGEQRVLEVLLRLTDTPDHQTLVWIGGAYNPTCGFWEWVYIYVLNKIFFQTDGHTRYSYGYTNWLHGEPHNTPNFCVALSVDSHSFGKWIPSDCGDPHNFICQWNECQRWSWDEFHCQHQRGCYYNTNSNHCGRKSEVPLPTPQPER